jgi:hypothetical protein
LRKYPILSGLSPDQNDRGILSARKDENAIRFSNQKINVKMGVFSLEPMN